jgi:N-acetylneuraminic acid mutarotase
MHDYRGGPSLTALKDGRILAAGGWTNHCGTYTELYDPATGLWSETGQLSSNWSSDFGSLLLPDGRVLLIGGFHQDAEIYDPATGIWSDAGTANPAYVGDQSVALLQDGRVLLTGGRSNFLPGTYVTSSVEIWDPVRHRLTPAHPMHQARENATATTLPDGTVLVAGGDGTDFNSLTSTEIYEPAHDLWTVGPSTSVVRYEPSATLLARTNEVVLVGGYELAPSSSSVGGKMRVPSAVTDVYDVTTHSMRRVADLHQARGTFAATALPDGRLIVMGGAGAGAFSSTEIFDPRTERWSMGPSMSISRCMEGATLLMDGQVLVAGGYNYDYTTYPGQYPTYGPISNSEVISPS